MKQFMKNKKAIAMILLIAMLCSIMPTAVWADDSIVIGENQYGDITENYELMATTGSAVTMTTAQMMQLLMDNIASTYENSSNKWNVMDLANYSRLYEAKYQLSETAKQNYLNTVIQNIQNGNYDEDNGYGSNQTNYSTEAILPLTALGIDVTKLYSVNSNTLINAFSELASITPYISEWVTPYTLMAYNQGIGAGANEAILLSGLLALQNDDGGFGEWGSSVDSAGETLAALSFYRDKEEVQVTIQKAVTYLSNQISDGGVYADGWSGYNANSTAMAVIGLAAVYDKDDEIITALFEKSVQGLLSFAVHDNTGFWKAPDTTIAHYKANEQGFRALIAASQVMKTGEAFNVYDFSANELEPGRATGAGVVVGPSAPPAENDDITVKMSIRADNGYWMRNKSIILDEGSTVYHALVKAIESSGITQEGAESGYVEYMTYNGKTLAEFDLGMNSGWLYTVNGELPEVGLLDYELANGDTVLWYYTEDWTQDSLAGSRVEDKKEDKQDENKQQTIPINTVFTDVTNHWASASIQYVYDNGILTGVSNTDFAPEATFNRAMMATVLHRMDGSPAHTWSYPFTDVSDIAWYAGSIAWAYQNELAGGMTDTSYEPERPITREQLAVMLMRYAQYKGYDTTGSADIAKYSDALQVSDYAQEAMEWAVSIGLIGGRTGDTLTPQGSATRAEVAVMLERFITLYQPVDSADRNK